MDQTFVRRITQVVMVIVLALWSVVGFLIWIPMLIRETARFSIMVTLASLSSGVSLHHAKAGLDASITLYVDGFARVIRNINLDQDQKELLQAGGKLRGRDFVFLVLDGLWILVFYTGLLAHIDPSTNEQQAFSEAAEHASVLDRVSESLHHFDDRLNLAFNRIFNKLTMNDPKDPSLINNVSFAQDVSQEMIISKWGLFDGSELYATDIRLLSIQVIRKPSSVWTVVGLGSEITAELSFAVCNNDSKAIEDFDIYAWYTGGSGERTLHFGDHDYTIKYLAPGECITQARANDDEHVMEVFGFPYGVLYFSDERNSAEISFNLDEIKREGGLLEVHGSGS